MECSSRWTEKSLHGHLSKLSYGPSLNHELFPERHKIPRQAENCSPNGKGRQQIEILGGSAHVSWQGYHGELGHSGDGDCHISHSEKRERERDFRLGELQIALASTKGYCRYTDTWQGRPIGWVHHMAKRSEFWWPHIVPTHALKFSIFYVMFFSSITIIRVSRSFSTNTVPKS
jgi:hypothetical protein